MSKKPQSYEEKKRFSIVQKPFSIGQINLFHPHKKNPNGHIASAKLLPKDTLNNVVSNSVELITEQDIFFTSEKLIAIALIIISNLTAATVISLHKKAQLIASTETNQRSYISGETNLAQREFVELNLNNLKNIAPVTETQNTSEEAQDKIPKNMPLAIPPTNLPQNIELPKIKENTQYYYILSEYNGDRSLQLAKTKVPNVSLINFSQGVFIYMGAFTQKESARQFVEQLKKIGLEGYIYPFE